MIGLKAHNVMDYLIAAILILTPFAMQFARVAPARNVFLVLGIGLFAYSIVTRYYYSIAKIIPLGLHMTLDCIAGIVLLFAPNLFNYRDLITSGPYVAHIILGLGALGLVALTKTRTEAAKTPEQHRETDGQYENLQKGPQVHV